MLVESISAHWESRHSLLTPLTYSPVVVTQSLWMSLTFIDWSQVSQSISAHGESRHSLLTPLTYALLSSRSRCGCCWRLSVRSQVSQSISAHGESRHSLLTPLTYQLLSPRSRCGCRWHMLVESISAHWESRHSLFTLLTYALLSSRSRCVMLLTFIDWSQVSQSISAHGESRHSLLTPLTYSLLSSRSRCGRWRCCQVSQSIWGVTSLERLSTVVVTQSYVGWINQSSVSNHGESRHSLLTPLTYVLLSSRSRCGMSLTFIDWSQVSQSISAHGESRHSLLTPLTYVLLSPRSRCGCCRWHLWLNQVSQSVNQSAYMGVTSLATHASHLRSVVATQSLWMLLTFIGWSQVSQSISAHGESRHSLLTPLTYALLSSRSRCGCRWHMLVESSESINQRTWGVTSLATHASHLRPVVVTQSLWMLLLTFIDWSQGESIDQRAWGVTSLATHASHLRTVVVTQSLWMLLTYYRLESSQSVSQSARMGSHVTRYSRLSLTLCCRHAVVVDVSLTFIGWSQVSQSISAHGESRHSLLTPLTYPLLSSRSRCGCCWHMYGWIESVSQPISAHGESRHSLLTLLTYPLLLSRSRCGCYWHMYGWIKSVSQSANQCTWESRHSLLTPLTYVLLSPRSRCGCRWRLSIGVRWVNRSAHMGSHVTRYSRLSLTSCCRHAVVVGGLTYVGWIKWVNRSVHMGSHVTRYSRLSLTSCCRHAVVVGVVDICWLKSSESINQRTWESRHSLLTPLTYVLLSSRGRCGCRWHMLVESSESINQRTWESRHSLLTLLTYVLLLSRSRCRCCWRLSVGVKWVNRSARMGSHVTRYSRLSLTYCCRHAVVEDIVDVYRLESSESVDQRACGVTSLATHTSHLQTFIKL